MFIVIAKPRNWKNEMWRASLDQARELHIDLIVQWSAVL